MKLYYSNLPIFLSFVFALGLLISAWPFLILVWRIMGIMLLVFLVVAMFTHDGHVSEKQGLFGTLLVDTSSSTTPVYTIVIEDNHLDPFFEEYDTVIMEVIRK